mgnify:CR=1 FL=1
MIKKIGIILFFVAAVGARHAVPLQGLPLLSDIAFADSYTQDGKPCPPECVSDSMEIVTWYPSPYNEYEELRLYPVQRDDAYCTDDKKGLMYYNKTDDKVYVCKGNNDWEEVGGGSFWKSSGNNLYYASGKVGIGTSSPTAGLHIASEGIRMDNVTIATNRIISVVGYAQMNIDGTNYAIPYYSFSQSLTQGAHSEFQCTSEGGTVYTDSGGVTFCRMPRSACLTGWNKYLNWTSTSPVSQGWRCNGWSATARTGSHSWSNTAVETDCLWVGNGPPCSCNVISASIYEIGCW